MASRDRPRRGLKPGRAPRGPRGNVIPIEGWLQPMLCPRCAGDEISQVDRIECAYPVVAERRPHNVVQLDFAASRIDLTAVGLQCYRCRDCDHEWPVETGTRFVEAEEG